LDKLDFYDGSATFRTGYIVYDVEYFYLIGYSIVRDEGILFVVGNSSFIYSTVIYWSTSSILGST